MLGSEEFIVLAPVGYSLCAAIIKKDDEFGQQSGYVISGDPIQGIFSTYNIRLATQQKSSPSNAGTTITLVIHFFAVKSEYVGFKRGHEKSILPPINTASDNAGKIECPQNTVYSSKFGAETTPQGRRNVPDSFWQDGTEVLDLTMPPGCPAGGYSEDPENRCYRASGAQNYSPNL